MKEFNDIPVVVLKGPTLFPEMFMSIDVPHDVTYTTCETALKENKSVIFVSAKDKLADKPTKNDIFDVGCLGVIKQFLKVPNSTAKITIQGLMRVKIKDFTQEVPFLRANAIETEDVNTDTLEAVALMRSAKDIFSEYCRKSMKVPREAFEILINMDAPGKFADAMADAIKQIDKQKILEESDVEKRLELVCKTLNYENEMLKVSNKVKERVDMALSKNQKEYYLREQIKAIQEELGEGGAEIEELRKKIEASDVDETIKEKFLKDFTRMARLPSGTPEYGVVRNYLEWVVELPWKTSSEDNNDLKHAQEILDEDHFGLEKIKDRIIEYLAVRQLTKNSHGPILCLAGPPGVGKTSIAKSIARALGKKYVRMSLGGVHDEAEIRGHRKTYIGAMPGRIMYNIKLCGTNNPVFLLDEIDKISSDYKGDPSSALLEVLDPEQNFQFRDNYLEVPFDLSEVLFIATANNINTIPRPLLDRMELIDMTGYTELEKLEIAKRHLIGKQIKENGLPDDVLSINDDALKLLINGYTKESGVRNLEREIAKICRKTARKILEDKIDKVRVTEKNLKEFVGILKYIESDVMKEDEIGAATGLAWTAVGGETLTIEVTTMSGKGEIQLTGQLGDVMKESAKTALSYIRANADKYDIAPETFTATDLHIHVPEGAIPKDGPSAGITLATAILSALTGRAVKSGIAMTGEITLRGHVLPIGGLKEKSLAALRAGITDVIIPDDNKKDLEELPETVKDKIRFIPVTDIGSVFKTALI